MQLGTPTEHEVEKLLNAHDIELKRELNEERLRAVEESENAADALDDLVPKIRLLAAGVIDRHAKMDFEHLTSILADEQYKFDRRDWFLKRAVLLERKSEAVHGQVAAVAASIFQETWAAICDLQKSRKRNDPALRNEKVCDQRPLPTAPEAIFDEGSGLSIIKFIEKVYGEWLDPDFGMLDFPTFRKIDPDAGMKAATYFRNHPGVGRASVFVKVARARQNRQIFARMHSAKSSSDTMQEKEHA
jgi:hypothetical protein